MAVLEILGLIVLGVAALIVGLFLLVLVCGLLGVALLRFVVAVLKLFV